MKAKTKSRSKNQKVRVKIQKAKGKVQKARPSVKLSSQEKWGRFGSINVPKDREVPFGAITPAPVKQQELFMTSNWRIVRPVIDHERCTRCFTCYISCPDSCWSFDEKAEKMEWNWKFCKGCQICINECPADALKAVPELDFEDGVVRLEKPF